MAEVSGSGAGVISWPPLGGGWQREALTGGENERILSLPPSRLRRATSLTEGGKDGGYGNPSVALRATPPSQREARRGSTTIPPATLRVATSLYTREALEFRACGRGDGRRGFPRQSADWLAMT